MSEWRERVQALKEQSESKPPAAPPRPITSSNGHAPGGDHAKYVAVALERELANVREAAHGTRNHTLNTAAFSLGQLVAAGHLDHTQVAHALTEAALAVGLGKTETEATINSGLTAGGKTPRIVPDLPPTPELRVFDPSPPAGTDELWEARSVLAHIRDFARARRVSPWATLGVVLARVVAEVPPHVVLPALVGGHASLNLFTGIVGRSGNGKGAAEAAAADAVSASDFAQAGVGSGEGIAHMFCRRVKGEVEQHTTAVLFSVPEIDTLTALGDRRGTTLFPELRKAWTGEQLGFSYADKDKRLPVLAHHYRLCLIAGIQPGRAGALLDDTDGGTPQRFVWLPSTDPEAPDTAPEQPKQWNTGLTWNSKKADIFSGRIVLDVCQTARDTIDQARLARLRGDGEALDGHTLLCRLKVAAALAILDQRDAVTDEDWRLAGLVMVMSTHTRTSVMDDLQRSKHERNERQAHAEAARTVIVSDQVESEAVKRACRRVVVLLRKAGDWVSHADLRRTVAHRQRPYFDMALDKLIEIGQIVSEDVEYRGQSGIRYRLVEESK